MPIIDNSVCGSRSIYGNIIKKSMLCAGYLEEGGIDACQVSGPIIYRFVKAFQFGLSHLIIKQSRMSFFFTSITEFGHIFLLGGEARQHYWSVPSEAV